MVGTRVCRGPAVPAPWTRRRSAFDLAALGRALGGARFDPALALAGILALAGVAGLLARALALAGIEADAMHLGIVGAGAGGAGGAGGEQCGGGAGDHHAGGLADGGRHSEAPWQR